MSDILQRAQNAELFLESLSLDEREKITPLVEEIKTLQAELDVLLIEFEVAERCANCTKGCCTVGIENILTEEYLFFLLFDIAYETYFKIWEVLQQENHTENCRFLAKDGCIIPPDARSFICKTFFCGKFGPVRKIVDAYSEKLHDVFFSLQLKVRELRGRVDKQGEYSY